MREFQRDRETAYDKLEAAKQQAESLERRCKDYAGAIIGGIEGHYQKCKESLDYFLQSFPFLVGSPHSCAWWEYFKKDSEKALKDIWDLTKKIEAKSADLGNDDLKNE